MSEVSDLFEVGDGSVLLHVHVQPRAGRTAVAGRHGRALKVRVTAPPADGRANDAVVALVADTLGVRVSAVSIESGARSRVKRLRVQGLDPSVVESRLREAIEAAGNPRGGSRR